jgi:hypothetical protein
VQSSHSRKPGTVTDFTGSISITGNDARIGVFPNVSN